MGTSVEPKDPVHWTNQEDLWRETKCDINDCILWSMFHKKRTSLDELTSLPSWNKARKIFLIDSEALLYEKALALDPRIHYWDCTYYDHPNFNTLLWWFAWCNQIESHVGALKKLLEYKEKTSRYMFDALFGVPKRHRLYVDKKISMSKHQEKFLTNFLNTSPEKRRWIEGCDFDENQSFSSSCARIDYYNQQSANISCFIPYKIYNDSWYSIICETNPHKIFYTEKTAKPLLSKRLFINFGAQYGLKHLQSFGFQTFGDVIDESYDNIKDAELRWQAAWQQVEYLLTIDPKIIYEKIEPKLLHNQQTILKINYKDQLPNQIKKILQG